MSIHSDAAKQHIESLLRSQYGEIETHRPTKQKDLTGMLPQSETRAFREYRFNPLRKWRMDWAVPEIKCAIELDGGLFVKGAHANPAAIRANYEKLNDAAKRGWRVWRYIPEQIIKAGRKGARRHTIRHNTTPINLFSPCLRNPVRCPGSGETAMARMRI